MRKRADVLLSFFSMNIFHRLVFLLLFAVMWASCNHSNPGGQSSERRADSLRLQAVLESAYDLQFEHPDSAFAIMQPAGAEALRLELYRPLYNFYKYAVTNRLILANDTAAGRALALEAVRLAARTGDSLHLGDAAFCMGMLHGYTEATDSSSYYFRRCAEFLENGQDKSAQLDAWHNLAEMTRIQGDYVAAEKYLLKNLDATRTRNEPRVQAIEYGSLYEVEEALGRAELAKAYLDSSTMFYAKAGVLDDPWLLRTHGDHALKWGRPDTALSFYRRAFHGFLQAGDSTKAATTCLNMARAFSKVGSTDSAAAFLRKAESFAAPASMPLTSQRAYYGAKLDLPEGSLSPSEQTRLSAEYITLLNSFLEKNQKLIGTQYMHEMEQQEKDQLILRKTLQSARRGRLIWALGISAAAFLTLAFFTYLYWRKKRELALQKEKLSEQSRHLEVLQARLDTQLQERARISQELHDDLGATLTSISLATELLNKKGTLESSRELDIISTSSADLVDKMNEIVWSLNTGNDTVQSLAAYIRKFAGPFLEEAGVRLEFSAPLSGPDTPLPGYIRRSLYLTVKEALHNIVKHAQASQVTLLMGLDNGQLHINIEDDGVGLKETGPSAFGNGLKNMKSNLKALGGAIRWSVQNGTQVAIVSPVV